MTNIENRVTKHFHDSIETKQRVAAAQHYLAGMKQLPLCRFDAVLLNGLSAKEVEWLPNAFEA